MMRTFKIYSLFFQIHNTVINYSHHVVHYIPRTYFSPDWKFVPFDHLQVDSVIIPILQMRKLEQRGYWNPERLSDLSRL